MRILLFYFIISGLVEIQFLYLRNYSYYFIIALDIYYGYFFYFALQALHIKSSSSILTRDTLSFDKTSYIINIFLFIFGEIHTGLRLRNQSLYFMKDKLFFIIYWNWISTSHFSIYIIQLFLFFIVLFRNYDNDRLFCSLLLLFSYFAVAADKPRLFYVVSIKST